MTGLNSYEKRFAKQCICKGSGLVEIWNDGSFITLGGNKDTRSTVIVACSCSQGEWLNERATRPGRPVYDRYRHTLVNERDEPEMGMADAYANDTFRS